ncbi:MAG: SMC-Scp complex subunit ScpB [Pyramidobacter sp.]|nr:SMC-Scp complex subunit ScpB [Pyramidobacter sp.]
MSSSAHGQPDVQLCRKIEAILFIASDGAAVSEIAASADVSSGDVKKALAHLREQYAGRSGLEIAELGGKWFMSTAGDMSETLQRFRAADESEHVRLSRASMETLAVIAYNQPVTRSEIEEIRGVRCDRVIDTLLGYGLVRIAGRRKSTGSPLLYRTADKFLEIFGLGAISDLPTIAEIDELRKHREADAWQEDEKALPGLPGDESLGETDYETE